MPRAITHIGHGEVIDIYTILTELPMKGRHRVFEVECNLCDTTSTVYLSNMRRGSNGCKHCRRRTAKFTHGLATTDKDGKRDPIYDKWFRVKDRCYNPNNEAYDNYGGRGIKISGEFLNSKVKWVEYLKSLPNYGKIGYYSLDRINNEGHYERGNLRWATRTMQNKNRRNRND